MRFKRILIFFSVCLFFAFSGVSGMLIFSPNLFIESVFSNQKNEVSDPPTAEFSFEEEEYCGNSPIQFTNLSTGNKLTYLWQFGDGTTSVAEEPQHVFDNAIGNGTQTFQVTLTVTDSLGITATKTNPITINQIPSVAVSSDRNDTDFDNLPYFIVCDNDELSEFTFYNNSSTISTNASYLIDWGDGSEAFEGEEWTELTHAYSIGVYYLNYTVTGGNGCIVNRRIGVFIGSNPAVGFGNPGNTNICSGEALTFPITGTENNPIGTTYTVTFSDGTPPQVFSHPPPATVSHIFESTSCGQFGAPGFGNSFSATILAENPCSRSSAQVVPIYVSEKPEPIIGLADSVYCENTFFNIFNQTLYGNEVNNNGQCTTSGKFVWEISPETGWELSADNTLGVRNNPEIPNSWVNGSPVLTPRFTEPGIYTIKLISGNRCGIEEREETICIISEPIASFEVDQLDGCGPISVKTTNTSNILGTCADGGDFFRWSVAFQGGECSIGGNWEFAEGSSFNDISPEFNFINPGDYIITQQLITSCGVFTASELISVYSPPSVSLGIIPDSCGELTISPTSTVLLCSEDEATFKWTFEGGIPSTSSNADPGPIEFKTIGNKVVTLEVTNSCGTTSSSITFNINPIPEIDLGPDKEICKGETLVLDSEIIPEGNYSYSWTASPFSNIQNANSANPTVRPEETTTYTVVATNIQTTCSIESQVTVTVIPAPSVEFSIPDQIICSGEASEAVILTSDLSEAIIEWTSVSNGAEGVEPEGLNEIPSQTIINKSNNPIEVLFLAKIASENLGSCEEVVATYKITVNPEPVYQDEELEICSSQSSSFTPQNMLSGSTFTWTVSAPSTVIGAESVEEAQNTIPIELVNNSDNPETVIYNITPFLGICQGQSFLLSVTVLPSPAIEFSLSDQTLCTGSESQEVLISSNVADAVISWTSVANGVSGVLPNGNGTIPIQNLFNPTSEPITVEFIVFASTGGQSNCEGLPKTYQITVNPTLSVVDEVSNFSGFGISCFGANDGSISVDPQGGNGNFTLTWTGPNGFTASSTIIENLIPGDYTLLVEDDFGCSLTRPYTINEPEQLVVDLINSRDVFCKGDETGRIEVAVSGGIVDSPYLLNWTKDGQPFPSSSLLLENIAAGIYELTVFDNNNCTVSTGPIQIEEPEQRLEINIEKGDISCYEANDGFLRLDISGGVEPYTVAWDFGSNLRSFDNVGPGQYSVTVSDQAGCILSQSVSIIDAPLFKVNAEVDQISCFGEKNGHIQLNIEGGTEGVTIRWDNGEELENLFNLDAGTYGVTVSKFGSCEVRREFTILQPDPLLIESSVVDAFDCDNPQSGSIFVNPTGGNPPFNYRWSNGSTEQNLTNIPSGTYGVSIEDSKGCLTERQFTVKRPVPISVATIRTTNVNCEPREILEELNISITGGSAPYTISWSGGIVSNNGLTMSTGQSGLYVLTITDGQGCEYQESYQVENTDVLLEADIESIGFDQYNAFLVGIPIQFQNKSIGNIISYFWDFGDGNSSTETNPTHTYQTAGEFEVKLQAIDAFGCILELVKEIKIIDYFLVVPNVFTPNSDGINDYFFPKFLNLEKLEFWVLNKWGETIFYTDDIQANGWDGTVMGDMAMPGNYVYKLKFQTVDGRIETKTDVFLLLK
ncbi:PKD domain-containing protein [Aquiflexum lacus]|uniref:PKD domain-containing protein n=1 Tax=Aquiflexum lacus TaxID=2483805 RepID=UPI001895DD4B|nr:PKD domain-containing protein [Aquiflexum lacus]